MRLKTQYLGFVVALCRRQRSYSRKWWWRWFECTVWCAISNAGQEAAANFQQAGGWLCGSVKATPLLRRWLMWVQPVEWWHVWHMIRVCALGMRCQSLVPALAGSGPSPGRFVTLPFDSQGVRFQTAEGINQTWYQPREHISGQDSRRVSVQEVFMDKGWREGATC